MKMFRLALISVGLLLMVSCQFVDLLSPKVSVTLELSNDDKNESADRIMEIQKLNCKVLEKRFEVQQISVSCSALDDRILLLKIPERKFKKEMVTETVKNLTINFYEVVDLLKHNKGSSLLLSTTMHNGEKFYIDTTPILTGRHVKQVIAGIDQDAGPALTISLDDDGAKIISDFTSEHIGQRMAIMLCDAASTNELHVLLRSRALDVTTIKGKIEKTIYVPGLMSIEDAHFIANIMNSGMLVAPVHILSMEN